MKFYRNTQKNNEVYEPYFKLKVFKNYLLQKGITNTF